MKTIEKKQNNKRNKIIGLLIIIIALLLLLRGCTENGDNQFTKLFKQVDVFLEVNKEKNKSRDQVYKIAKIVEDSRGKKTKDIIKDFQMIGNVSVSELKTQKTLITDNTDVDINLLIENHSKLIKKYDSKITLEQVSLIVNIIVQLDKFKEENNTLNDEGIDQVQRLLTSYYGYLLAYEIRMQPEAEREIVYRTITNVQTNVKEIIKFTPNTDHKFLNTLTGISNIIGKVKLENDHSVETLKDVMADLDTLDSKYINPLKNLINDFIIIIEENSLEISVLNDEVAAANNELEGISNENDTLKEKLSTTQDEVIAARETLTALNEQLAACAKELSDTKEISAAREEELLTAITNMEEQLNAVVAANDEYEKALATATEELQQAYEVQTGLHVIVNQYSATISDLSTELETTKTMLADEKTENINLNLQIDTLLIKTSNDQMYINQLEDANTYLENLIAVKDIDFQNKLLEIESLNFQLDTINNNYLILQENLNNQVTRNDELESLLSDANANNTKLEELLANANTENISLTLQNQNILNQLAIAEQNILALNLEKTDLMTINLLMQEELNTLNQELINCHALLSAKDLEIDNLNASLNNLNTITNQLENDIAQRDLTIKDLSEAIQEKNDQINNLNGQIAAMNVSIENLSIDKQLLEEALLNCKDELDALLADNNTLNNEIVQKNEEIQALSNLLDQTLIGLNTAQTEISALQEIVASSEFKNDQLSNELTQAQNTINSYETEINNLNNLLDDRDATITNLNANIVSLNNTINAKDDTISGLDDRISELVNENDVLQVEIGNLNNQLNIKTDQVIQLQTSLSELQALYDAAIAGSTFAAFSGSWSNVFGSNKSTDYFVECANENECNNVGVEKDLFEYGGYNVLEMNKKGNIYNVCTTITDSNEAKKAAALIGAAMEFISHYTGIPTNSVKTLQIKFGNNCQSKEEARFSL